MADICWSSVRGRVARLTKTDECCRPIPGPCSTLATDGFVTVSYSSEIESGTEILVKKANGAICVNDKSCDVLKRINIEVEFCRVQPSIFSLMTGNPLVTDFKGDPVGMRVGETISCAGGFALEVWSDVPGAVCTSTGVKQYGYFLLPCLTGGTLGDFTLEDDAATFTVTGYSRSAQGWGRGPYPVDAQDAANTPGPLLTPFIEGEHMDMHLTSIAPPDTGNCECQELVLPAGYFEDDDSDGTVDIADPFPANPLDAVRLTGTLLDNAPATVRLNWTAMPTAAGYSIFRNGAFDSDVASGRTATLTPVANDDVFTVRGYTAASAPAARTTNADAAGIGPASNSYTVVLA